MPYKITPKIVLLFILFFVLTYFEDKSIGGLSFAALWKAPIILYLIVYTYIFCLKESSKHLFILIGGLFSIKLLLHTNALNSLTPEIQTFLKYMIIPSVFFYLLRTYNKKPQVIVKLLFWLAFFLIWNNVPYLLKIVEPKVQMDYSIAFGEGMADDVGFSGAYLTIHNQAVYMAGANLFLIYMMFKFPTKFPVKSIGLILTLGIGLYSLYLSFARTGWLLFLIGLLIIVIKEFKRRQIGRIVMLFIISSLGIIFLFLNNESFRKRVLDERQYNAENQKAKIGSGRLIFAESAVLNWWESGFESHLIGYGADKGKEKMEKRIGMRIFAHNSYIEILQTSGIVGLFLFIFWVISLFKLNNKFFGEFSSLSIALLVGWLFVGSVQTFDFVYLNLFIAGVLAINFSVLKKEYNKRYMWTQRVNSGSINRGID